MATPLEYYQSLPPVAKTYGVICILTSGAYHLGLYSPWNIALSYEDVIKRFQIWRLITNFFFIGPFSFTFAFRLLIIARQGVQLERGPFDKRTADYVWMFLFGSLSLLVIAAIPFLWSPFMGASLVFMIVYVWGREFPNERLNIHGLFELKGFYLPWYMLAIDLILGNPLKPDLLGMVAGHLFYFLTVLYPLSGGRNICKTPLWVHKLVAFWGEGSQFNSPWKKNRSEEVVFKGRSYRLDGTKTSTSAARAQAQASTSAPAESSTPEQTNPAAAGVAFSGKSHRLNTR
ncbi:derlin-1-like [Cornus florida]|uniref:derlin-1-like n=1 Tax=Cornus florida TaxID=4283 RepID=UPI00289B2469|nr:derlin-1-like [Cornus florida]